MKIKVFKENGKSKVIFARSVEDILSISIKFKRWEYLA